MGIGTFFTIAKIWKHPKCLRREKWIKKLWYRYTMEYYQGIRKDELVEFSATWMDLESIMCKIGQRERVRHRMISVIHGNTKKQSRRKTNGQRQQKLRIGLWKEAEQEWNWAIETDETRVEGNGHSDGGWGTRMFYA